MTWTRRRFLARAGAACGAGLCGFGAAGCGASGGGAAGECTEVSSGSDPTHCLVEPLLIRVPGAATLQAGQAQLANVDDNTAVIVARDAAGLHALSGICTHACCVVSLCNDASCTDLTPTPAACASTPIAAGDAEAESIICPCHGSAFRLGDGGVLSGPARAPLPAYSLTVDGDDVVVDTGTLADPAERV